MYQQGIILFCMAIVHPFLCYGKANTVDDPMLKYFNVNPETVLESELVKIDVSGHKHKRSDANDRDQRVTRMRFRAFDQNFELWLHPRDSLLATVETPVCLTYEDINAPGRVSYVLQPNAMENVGQLYEDQDHDASVVISTDEHHDGPKITGKMRLRRDSTVLMIKPLSREEPSLEHKRKNSSEYNSSSNAYPSMEHDHQIYRLLPQDSDAGEDHNKVDISGGSVAPFPTSLYLKLFVQLDYSFWNALGQSDESKMTSALEYSLIFWNGVDLYYRHLENPNIRLHIAAIAIATSPIATPYIWDSLSFRDGKLDSDATLDRARSFFYDVGNQIPFDMYDIAVTMTKLTLKNGINGIAKPGVICSDPVAEMEQPAVALIHDYGAFGSLKTAAHEIGHVLGLDHDGNMTDACHDSHGFIMASHDSPSENSSLFSTCSLAEFNELLQTGNFQCLEKRPNSMAKNLPIPLPGEILSLDEQCQLLGYLKAYNAPEYDPCTRMVCMITNTDGTALFRGAAPGTRCENGNDEKPRFCFQSHCVTYDQSNEED